MPHPNLLLINPWIYDFAAYDLWAKPLGLLYLAAVLRENGFEIGLIDCLDRSSLGPPAAGDFGTGKFLRTPLPKPAGLKDVPRNFCRYGISHEEFKAALAGSKKPAAILVTSLMTYWYPGAFEAIRQAKKVFPGVPVILGGIYATLCTAHAREFSGADYVLPGPAGEPLSELLFELTGSRPDNIPDPWDLDDHPYPAYDLLPRLDYICLMTSRGCPFRCAYCASRKLTPFFRQRDPERVIAEIAFSAEKYNLKDFALYDDALLVKKKHHIWPILETVKERHPGLRFHTPNALHVREIDDYTAELLYGAGFKTIRLGFETADMSRHKALDCKLEEHDLVHAVQSLRRAGFVSKNIGVYILAGLPYQTWQEISDSVDYVLETGAVPYLAEYSPIPGSPLWSNALESARFPINQDPIYQNNTLFPCAPDFSWDVAQGLKMRVRTARNAAGINLDADQRRSSGY